MKYSTRTRYGLRFLVYLALHGRDRFVQLSEVEVHERISLRYLEQIVRMLKPSGVLESRRGKYGGYRLAKSAADIEVAGLVMYLEGDLAPVAFLGSANKCRRSADCPTLPMWRELQEIIHTYLRNKSLQDLAEQSEASHIHV